MTTSALKDKGRVMNRREQIEEEAKTIKWDPITLRDEPRALAIARKNFTYGFRYGAEWADQNPQFIGQTYDRSPLPLETALSYAKLKNTLIKTKQALDIAVEALKSIRDGQDCTACSCGCHVRAFDTVAQIKKLVGDK